MNVLDHLTEYDWIVVNTSAGKDSQAMMHWIVRLADCYGVRDRLVAVHCDLGRVEWRGTRALAAEHAAHYGLRFEVVKRDRDLLHQIEFERLMFPDMARRYCTSDHKTSQVAKLHTALKLETWATEGKRRKVRILDCLGLRADESDDRSKRIEAAIAKHGEAFERTDRDNSEIRVDRWFPIAEWTESDVWRVIKTAGTRHHKAYDYGMSRLSCVFCVFASKRDLRIAAKHNPKLAREYLRIERKLGHNLKSKTQSLADIIGDIVTTKSGRKHLRLAA